MQINLSDDSKLLTMALCTSNCHLQMSGRPSTVALKVWCWYVKATGNYKISCATVCMQINRQEVANRACLQDIHREELEADEQSNI